MCSVIAAGLDPNTTLIEKYVSLHPVPCRDCENVEKCKHAMQEHKLRRIPIVECERPCLMLSRVQQVPLGRRLPPERWLQPSLLPQARFARRRE